jgi:hypothetical protein
MTAARGVRGGRRSSGVNIAANRVTLWIVDESDVMDELFGGARDDFLTTRTARVRQARAAGQADVARRIGALRKPTVAAWLVNQLVRRHPDDATALARVAGELGDAHRHGSGDELRAAGAARRDLLRHLENRTREVAREAGVRLGDDTATQVATTFQAALTDPAALGAVRGGRLSAALDLDPNVLDTWAVPDMTRVPAPRPKAPKPRSEPEPEPMAEAVPEPDPELVAAFERADEQARASATRRARAARELAAAQEHAATTEELLAEAKAKLDAARHDHQSARDAVEAARTALADATRDEKAAERELAKHPDPRRL